MSYITYNQNIVAELPMSEALNRVEYDPLSEEVLVYWESDTDRAYVCQVDSKDDFDTLLQLIETHQSGYRGYTKWIESRKDMFRRQDFSSFYEFYDNLSDYQKDHFKKWARQLLRGLW